MVKLHIFSLNCGSFLKWLNVIENNKKNFLKYMTYNINFNRKVQSDMLFEWSGFQYALNSPKTMRVDSATKCLELFEYFP